MKKLLYIAVIIIGSSLSFGQNLVPNPSFEDSISCPDNGWLSNVADWQSFSSSPDYFNSCVVNWSNYSVPNNIYGEQVPVSGNAYAGIFSYVEGEIDYSVDREILGVNLVSPLTIGQKYYVSFKVALTLNTPSTGSSLGINKMGARFSTVPYTNANASTIPPINNTAHVYTDSIITDSTEWTRIFGSFVADSSYEYVAIGNFFEVANTDTLHVISSNPFTPNAYFYVDDVCVSTDSMYTANYVYVGGEEVDLSTFNLFPNPATNVINVSNDESGSSYSLSIYNQLGEKIYSESEIYDFHKQIDASNFTDGLLIIEIITNNQPHIYKLLKH